LLEHFAKIEDPREPWRVAHPLPEILLLVVCGTIADCDDYDHIVAWGESHLPFLREILPYHYGVPGGRWLTLLMNRIDPGLFSACFTAWVREMWPERPDFVTTGRLVLGQEAVADKSNELTAIPILLERLGADDGLKGAVVTIAAAIRDAGAEYLLAVTADLARRDRGLLRHGARR
jgi:hypothetical protein